MQKNENIMIKKIIFLFILSCSLTIQAQYGYGSNNQSQRNTMQTQQRQAPDPNFNVERFVGIIYYDVTKAAKKSKVKLASENGKKFSKILTDYNTAVKNISRINSFFLSSTKKMVENFQKTASKSGDFSDQQKIMQKMNETLKPIAETLQKEDEKLDKDIKGLLTEKQYDKWIKYNAKLYKFFKKEKG